MSDEAFLDEAQLQKRERLLLEGLRAALGGPAEHLLYKVGKHEGLFPAKSGLSGEAAQFALAQGYLQHIRDETRGRAHLEWVTLTPKGIEFLYQHDSPKAVLGEMRELLRSARSGIPLWQEAVLKNLERFAVDVSEQMAKYLASLDALSKRVDEVLKRYDAPPPVDEETLSLVPWGKDVVTYLEHRKEGGATEDCSLPELFGAIRNKIPYLTLREFHEGLRRLAEAKIIKLLPNEGALPKPEYALALDGKLMYRVQR
jgi:hypothetical protein